MSVKHRQTIYILFAFLIVALLHFVGAITNMFIQNDMLGHIIYSSGLVINTTGVIVGVYNIYQGITLRKKASFWYIIFTVGVVCVWFNVYALTL